MDLAFQEEKYTGITMNYDTNQIDSVLKTGLAAQDENKIPTVVY